MLHISVPGVEMFDEATSTFITTKPQQLQLEHSLVSLSKWESKWHKPFLSKTPHTDEEMRSYVQCMTLTQNVDENVYKCLTAGNLKDIDAYIDDSMTATTFSKQQNQSFNREQITAELIYYWMISLNIPFECQKWHLNRLLTLVQVCDRKNSPPKKMTAQERNALNQARRAKYHTRG